MSFEITDYRRNKDGTVDYDVISGGEWFTNHCKDFDAFMDDLRNFWELTEWQLDALFRDGYLCWANWRG